MPSLISSSEKSRPENPDSSAGDGKGTAYHCYYCNKDITRAKCTVRLDLDLCMECFSVGAALSPHKSDHLWRALEKQSFEVAHPGWNSEEEMLIREVVKMYGLDNWDEVVGHVWSKTKDVCMEHYRDAYINSPKSLPVVKMYGLDNRDEVAGHVGTKTKEVWIEHYRDAYINTPQFSLDSTQVVGKDKNEVVAMGKDDVEDEIGNLEDKAETLSKSILGDEDDIWSRAYVDAPNREELVVDMGVKEADPDFVHQLKCRVVKACRSRAEDRSRYAALGDEERDLEDKTETLPKSILGDEDDIWSRAYVDAPKREELVVDRGVKEADPDFVHQLKCRVVKAYRRRAEDRSRYAALGDEERELCQKYDERLRFDSDEEHKQVIESLLAVHRFQKRKAAIKEARAAGCRTIAEFNVYHELIKEREAKEWKEYSEEEGATASQASSTAVAVFGTSNGNSNGKPRSLTTAELTKYLDREFKKKQKQAEEAARRKENSRKQQHLESKRKEEEAARGREISVDPANWNKSSRISPSAVSPGGLTVAEIDMNIQRLRMEDEERDPYWSNKTSRSTTSSLPQSEKPLCRSLCMTPRHYLKIKEDMTKLIINGRITQKSDSYRFFDYQIVPAKIDKIYDLLTNKGIAPPSKH